jgi:hypothetical protein
MLVRTYAAHHDLVGRPGRQRELPFAAVGRSGKHTTGRGMEQLLEDAWDTDARRR